ncbi:MAG: pentapeptide repeat-containing protein [Xenococcus sp. MO_188.B8]|nr:pentapeptide repeat-containing protein [Xenococcus sp. MO_188.B8]
MAFSLRELWQKISFSDAISGSADAAQAVFELAETINEQEGNSEKIKELAAKIPTLLEALNSPLGKIVNSTIPFLPIATGVIQFFIEANQKEPTIAEIIAIMAQAAYLESIREIIRRENINFSNIISQNNLQQELTKLENLELDDYQARLSLVYFSKSKFAEAFNEILLSRLIASSCEVSQAKILVKKVALNTSKYIYQVLPSLGDRRNDVLNWLTIGGQDEFKKYVSIDNYLEEKIAPLPNEKVFKEEFSFQDIYVPLKAKSLTFEGKEIHDAEEFILEEWVQKAILDETKKDQVIFIQAGAGRGKTVFCRMFADWARRNLHPLLTPILIRLRDIENYGQSFDQTLTNALSYARFVNDKWLADPDTRYLFLLDGFDELRIEGRATGGISRFIRQVGAFQEKFTGKENGHRIIMTGRPLALQGITDLPRNLERVKLLPMDEELQKQWFYKWQKVVIPVIPFTPEFEVRKLKNLLRSDECPNEVKNDLAKEPLLLYLIAKLHREGEIKQEDFKKAKSRIEAEILIYEKSLEFVLKELRLEWLQQQIGGLTIDNLERILMEAGLSVVQSGGEYAKVKMIEDRLDKDDSEAANTLRELRAKSGERAVTTALGAFYLRPAAGKTGGGVEFYHKSFSEFLCAKRLQLSVEAWTTLVKVGKREEPYVDDDKLYKQIYDLLGYGGLTPEIVEYLMGLLQQSDEFKPVELFERLEDFYFRWCDGEFIDADGTTLPQTKMRELKEQVPERDKYLGQRQVDVYAGLNIMILLLELHRYGQAQEDQTKEKLTFYPCGKHNDRDPERFLRIIGYSICLNHIGFRMTVGSFLKKVYLSGASLYRADFMYPTSLYRADFMYPTSLYRADFMYANLSEADLKETNLCRADLRYADLSGADLMKADLRYADLVYSDLRNANLEGANLKSANLEGANLKGANLKGANLEGANLKGANLEKESLQGANLFNANFCKANLEGAILKGAYFKEAKFLRANLANADFARANLCLAHFYGTNLERAKLEGANLKDAKFISANLSLVNLEDANVRGAKFRKNEGISESLKQDLIDRGAVFGHS